MRLPLLACLATLALPGCIAVKATETIAPPRLAQPSLREPVAPVARAYASATAPYAKSIIIPPGHETIRLPGIVPDALNPGSAAAAQYGDTEAQTASVLSKIAAALAEVGASEADVVAMTVYLVEPQPGAGMDFAGMMRAYGKHYGTATQPNRPVRSTVEVAGLVRPGMLVEIEVTAARAPR